MSCLFIQNSNQFEQIYGAISPKKAHADSSNLKVGKLE
jgi:hypothetical protein